MKRCIHWPMISSLYVSMLIHTVSQATMVIIAKAFNSAFSKTFTHDLACEELPGTASIRSLVIQISFTALVSCITLNVWVHASRSDAKETNSSLSISSLSLSSIKFMCGEMVGWAYKEIIAIFYVFIAGSFSAVTFDEERRLGDHLQGDGAYSEDESWSLTATYGILWGIISVVVFITFARPVLKLIQAVFWRNVICIHNFHSMLRGNREIEGIQEDEDPSKPFSREESDDLAFEFTNECIRTSFAYVANGTICGIIVSLTTNDYGPEGVAVVSAYGLLEGTCALIAAAGALRINRKNDTRGEEKEESPLIAFLIEWYATWSGFAIASLASSPAALSAQFENDESFPEWAYKLIRTCSASLFALYLLYVASRIRVSRYLCHCWKVEEEFGIRYGNILTMAAVYGFAVSWEEYFGDLACSFADTDGTGDGFSPTVVMWIYFLIILVTLFPIALLATKHRVIKGEKVGKKLDAHHQKLGMKLENSTEGNEAEA